jgi:hypothetical protein
LQHSHNLYFITNLDEKYQIPPMTRMTQPLVQIVPPLEAVGTLTHLQNLRLDLGHERGCTGSIIERNEVANVDEVCPCGGQDNQLCHDQDLSA